MGRRSSVSALFIVFLTQLERIFDLTNGAATSRFRASPRLLGRSLTSVPLMNLRYWWPVILALHTAPTAWAAEIVIAQVAPLSGLEATQARAYGAGMRLVFDQANASRTAGHRFTLIQKNDGGNPEETLALTRTLLQESRPLILAGYFGNKNLTNMVRSGVLEREKIALVGYRTTDIRTETPLVYNVRASLRDELTKITDHLATVAITRLGLFYEDGEGAAALVSAAEETAQKASATLVVKASHAAGSANVAEAVAAFLGARPQAIIMVSSGAAGAAFIERYRTAGGAAQLIAHSGTDIEQLAKRLGEEQMQGVAIAQVTPNPYKVTSRLLKEFNDLTSRPSSGDMPVSYAMIEGFINARVIVEAVRRLPGPVTRENVAQALDAMSNYDLGGYLVSFRPGSRTGSRFVELSIITGAGKIRQ
jgi:branched-chain amino acid transport system substrate-binding protein